MGSNLFGDIISDLGSGCTGTIAIAPSANINPENVIARGENLTPDMGGNASTQELGTEIEHEVLNLLEI